MVFSTFLLKIFWGWARGRELSEATGLLKVSAVLTNKYSSVIEGKFPVDETYSGNTVTLENYGR